MAKRCLSIPKLERKTIEKNRRNNMKTLYSHLSSLLPPRPFKETGFALTDQIDDAIDYIKNLQSKIEEEKKKQLMSKIKAVPLASSDIPRTAEIDVRETGPTVDVTITCGSEMNYLFYDTIRVIHEEGAEIVTANSSLIGNSVFCTFHAFKVKNYPTGYGRITKRLKELVHGQGGGGSGPGIDHEVVEEQARLDLWNFEAQPDIWEFEFPQVLML